MLPVTSPFNSPVWFKHTKPAFFCSVNGPCVYEMQLLRKMFAHKGMFRPHHNNLSIYKYIYQSTAKRTGSGRSTNSVHRHLLSLVC